MRRILSIILLVVFMAVSTGSALANGYHIVAPGETLNIIAVRYGVTVSALATANNIWNPNYIYSGQYLVIPSGYYPPAPAPAPSYPPAPAPGTNYYTVRPGDTLAGIARYYGSTASAIASANGIWNPNYIYAGQVLAIPRVPVIYNYYVAYGDTLGSIARHYGTTIWAISSYNGLWNPNLIYPGMLLRVPV